MSTNPTLHQSGTAWCKISEESCIEYTAKEVANANASQDDRPERSQRASTVIANVIGDVTSFPFTSSTVSMVSALSGTTAK